MLIERNLIFDMTVYTSRAHHWKGVQLLNIIVRQAIKGRDCKKV